MALLSADSTVVARVPGLVPLRRGGSVLVLAPETGASVLLKAGRLRAWGRLERPVPVGALRADLPGEELAAFLDELDRGGFLSVAGRPPHAPRPAPVAPERTVLKWDLQEDLPPGRLLVEFPEGDPGELRVALDRLQALRPGSIAWVRTRGELIRAENAEALEGAHLALCLHEVPSPEDEVLQRLPEALAAGLSVAPVAVVSRPGQALDFFRFLTGLGYRTMRFEGASARDLVALAQAAWAFPAPVQVHPLDGLARRLLSGTGGTHPDQPRCRRCGFQRTCTADDPASEECPEWRTLAEELLWLLRG